MVRFHLHGTTPEDPKGDSIDKSKIVLHFSNPALADTIVEMILQTFDPQVIQDVLAEVRPGGLIYILAAPVTYVRIASE